MSGAVYYVKASVGKHLLSYVLFTLAGVLCGCTQVVTLPVRTVIDLSNPPVHVEADSTIDLADEPESTNNNTP
jgi:hypothetical protein